MASLFLGKFRRGAADLSRVRIPELGCLGLKPVLSPSRGVTWSESNQPGFSLLYERAEKNSSRRIRVHQGPALETSDGTQAANWKPRPQSSAAGPHPLGSLCGVDGSV